MHDWFAVCAAWHGWMACCRYFEREQFRTLCSEVAFVGPHVTQCIKFMSGQSDLTELSLVISVVL